MKHSVESRLTNTRQFEALTPTEQLVYFKCLTNADRLGVLTKNEYKLIVTSCIKNYKSRATRGLFEQGYLLEIEEEDVIVIVHYWQHNKKGAIKHINSNYSDVLNKYLTIDEMGIYRRTDNKGVFEEL